MLFPIELLDESGTLQLSNEAHIDKMLRIGSRGFWIAWGEIVEHRFDPLRGWRQVFRKDAAVSAIGAFETFGIGDAEIFREERLGAFLFGFNRVNRLDHSAGKSYKCRPFRFQDCLTGQDGVPPERYF